MSSFVIKNSKIHGKGLFALEHFKKGEIVLCWNTSHILSKEDLDKLSKDEKKYVAFLDERYVVMQEPERYVNHSCNPNTHAKNFCYVALEEIEKGKEITATYSKELPLDTYCNCKSKNCKCFVKAKVL